MLYAISLFPILLYLLLIRSLDGFALSSIKKFMPAFVWGLIICAVLFGLAQLLKVELTWEIVIVEELLKYLPIAIVLYRHRISFFTETIIYGAAAGAGFATAENLFYVYFNSDMFTIGDSIIRGFGTSLLHIGCTALASSFGLVISKLVHHKIPKFAQFITIICALIPSLLIHFLYNLFLLPVFLQLILVVAVMIPLFIIINDIDNRIIHKWLDMCINNDIVLLAAMKEGKLKDTAAGQYLMSIKEKFQPEIFFDIWNYVCLFLELSIAAKSRMIMKEAGIDIPLDEKVHQENLEKIAEWKTLHKIIGPAATMALNPIISIKSADKWVIHELL